jgi:potassium-transporting ATPase KdpC subunit
MRTILISLKIFLFFTILTGIIYPLIITGIAQAAFYGKANGSMISRNQRTIGSRIIGQEFDSAIYFTPRPSANSYNSMASGGSNLALSNPRLRDLVTLRKARFIEVNELNSVADVPSEMLFASGSGLDPDISPGAALLQVDRISKARNFGPEQREQLITSIRELTESRQLLFFGEERINVLLLNLKLDQISKGK